MIVVTDEALQAARAAFLAHSGSELGALKDAIIAALPHLTDAGEPLAPTRDGLEGQYFSDQLDALATDIQAADTAAQIRSEAIGKRFDGLVDVVLRMEKRLTDLIAKSRFDLAAESADYPSHWTEAERLAERRHRENMAFWARRAEATVDDAPPPGPIPTTA